MYIYIYGQSIILLLTHSHILTWYTLHVITEYWLSREKRNEYIVVLIHITTFHCLQQVSILRLVYRSIAVRVSISNRSEIEIKF